MDVLKYYTIGKFAKLIGKSVPTLRLWDKQGKLKPHHVPFKVDESYTSKTSSLTEDIEITKELSKYAIDLTNVYNGKRVKRGLFFRQSS